MVFFLSASTTAKVPQRTKAAKQAVIMISRRRTAVLSSWKLALRVPTAYFTTRMPANIQIKRTTKTTAAVLAVMDFTADHTILHRMTNSSCSGAKLTETPRAR